jgi:hypothetical protein
VPAAHTLKVVQLAALLVLVYVPAAHAAQVRSAAADGRLLTKLPAAQFDQGWQAGALVAVLNWPVGQAEHTRSVTAEPSAATKLPGTQAVWFTQAVAGLAS